MCGHQTYCMSRRLAMSLKQNFGPNLGLKSPEYGPIIFHNNSYHYRSLLSNLICKMKQVQFEVDPPISNLGLMWIQTNATWVNVHISWKSYFEPNLDTRRSQFSGQLQITSIVIKNHWMKSECVTSDKLYQSMSNYELKIKFWTKFGSQKP